MQKNFAGFNLGRLLEDLMGLAQTLKAEGSSRGKSQLEGLLRKMDLVTRDEFEAVKAIAIAARTQSEELAEAMGHKKKKPTVPRKKTAKAKTKKK